MGWGGGTGRELGEDDRERRAWIKAKFDPIQYPQPKSGAPELYMELDQK